MTLTHELWSSPKPWALLPVLCSTWFLACFSPYGEYRDAFWRDFCSTRASLDAISFGSSDAWCSSKFLLFQRRDLRGTFSGLLRWLLATCLCARSRRRQLGSRTFTSFEDFFALGLRTDSPVLGQNTASARLLCFLICSLKCFQ